MKNRARRNLIAVSQRVDVIEDRGERRDSLDQKLTTLIWESGLFPCAVPNALFYSTKAIHEWLEVLKPQGIILSGGNDLGTCDDRDMIEMSLIEYAEKNKTPLLGICRGMQILARWAGVTMKKVEGHIGANHDILVAVDDENNWPKKVNSFHNYTLSECPEKFVITAKTEYGDIEAIVHQSLPWEGWMWHPEREFPTAAADRKRIRKLFKDKID
jgi:gamma-glutamyl-gamma-aminobutyrate hydrolase PuuD